MKNLLYLCVAYGLILAAEAQPVITQQPINQTSVLGGNAMFNVAVLGTGPFTYQWQFNGANLPANIITTIAGNGLSGNSGDGGAAVSADIYPPNSLAIDGKGNLIIVGFSGVNNNNNIRKVSTNGIITTFAGNGTNGYGGDLGQATVARFYIPQGVTIDNSNNVFIIDTGNARIRKISTNGIVTTFAGNGTYGYSGDGGFATNAEINTPIGAAVDSAGNVFFTDTSNYRVRKVSTNGIITTIAGNGTAGNNGAGGAAIGNGGAAINADVNNPFGVAVDLSGNVFIVGNNNIRKVSTNGIITSVAGDSIFGYAGYYGDGGLAINAVLNNPNGVTVDKSGNVFFADTGNNRIREISTNGIITTFVGNGTAGYSGDGGSATNAQLNQPSSVSIDTNGNLFIADTGNNRIRKASYFSINPSIALNYILTNNAGGYSVIIANSSGSITSIVANLTVLVPPSITIQPTSQIVLVGSNVTFSVTSVGTTPFSYQWCSNGVSVLNATNSMLILNSVQTNAATSYSVVVTNFAGSVTSSIAVLTVLAPPSIAQQPTNQLLILGGTATFSVTPGGTTPLKYQWYLANLVTARATAQMLSGFVYGTTVTNSGAGYTTVPRVQFIGGGGSGADGMTSITNGQVTAITMTNAGSGYTSAPAVLIDSPTGLLVGQTNATLNLNVININNAGGYYAVITNNYGSITSSVVTLTIAYPPSISKQPQNQTVGVGAGANINVIAAGTSPFGYQWWMTGGNQSNATAVPVVISGFVLSNTITSGGAGYLTIPIVQYLGGSGSGANGTAVVSNRMVASITLNSAGSGYTTPPTIQIAAPIAISLTGQTNSVLNLLAVTNGNAGNYFVLVTNNYGSVTSSIASLFVGPVGYNQISSPVLNNGKMRLLFVGLQGTNYALDRSFSLSPANWIPQVTNPADANGNLSFTNAPAPTTNNFWRIRSVP